MGGAVSESVAGSMVGILPPEHGPAFSKWLCLGIWLHQGFTNSYLNPKAPTKALLSVDGCQTIVAVGGFTGRTSYYAIVLSDMF